MPHPGLTDVERADPGHQVALGQVAVAHHHSPILRGAFTLVSLQILLDFVLNGRLPHLAGAFSNEVFQGRLSLKFYWLLFQREDFIFFHGASLSVRRVLKNP
jgi:hypothetical protein